MFPLKSRAVVADGKGHFTVDEIDVHGPKGDEVLLQIEAAGLCHTDWDSIKTWDEPFVVGHEGAGIVRHVGPDVKNIKVGDHVVLNWAIPCGKCSYCMEGLYALCEVNSPCNGDGSGHAHAETCLHHDQPISRSFHLGTMSEYTVVREAAVQKLNPDIPFPSASIMSCGVMTGFGSVVNAAKVAVGTTVAVLGCGGIGLNVIQASVISGATTIIAIDISAERLEQAKSFGATHGIISDPKDNTLAAVREKIWDITNDRGADYAFECTAIPALGAAPLALIRHGGMAVQVSGIEQTIDFDCTLFEWDKVYINPLYGKCNPDRDFPVMQSLYKSGDLKLDELITKTYAFDEIVEAFEDMLAGRLAKGVLIPSKSMAS